MDGLSRIQLIQTAYQMETNDKILKIEEINEIMLSDIEGYFYINVNEDIYNKKSRDDISIDTLMYTMQRNANNLMEIIDKDSYFPREEKNLSDDINKMLHYFYQSDKTGKILAPRYAFNRLIYLLAKFNTVAFTNVKIPEYMKNNDDNFSQVFLSYAYDDKLYTYLLFEYMYQRNIYLYVDWMHNSKISDGINLKETLSKELSDSNQLLFMRTQNSELRIPGNKSSLRSWCSWELGNFYERKKGNEKYLLNLYSVDGFKNPQLHGLNLLTNINDGRLQGTIIS